MGWIYGHSTSGSGTIGGEKSLTRLFLAIVERAWTTLISWDKNVISPSINQKFVLVLKSFLIHHKIKGPCLIKMLESIYSVSKLIGDENLIFERSDLTDLIAGVSDIPSQDEKNLVRGLLTLVV